MPDQLNTIIPLVHAAATLFMAGLIWFVQIVHYPLMTAVPAAYFSPYAREHQRRTTWVVAPVMGVEAATSAWLVLSPGHEVRFSDLPAIGAALLAVVWIATFTLQVPLHGTLSGGFRQGAWHRLVLTNWIRTVAWSARGVVALLLLR